MTSSQDTSEWEGIDAVANRLKGSCLRLHRVYRNGYLLAKSNQKYYDVPIIVLSGINSILIAGAQNYMSPMYVTLATCFISLVVSVIQSLKTFFRIDEKRDSMLSTHKDLFRLYVVMSVTLEQPANLRGIEPRRFLMDNYSEYQKILDKASVICVDEDPIYRERVGILNEIDT